MRGEFLDLFGARLYYYAAGTRGAGVPIVFLHGFPTSSHLWGEVVSLAPRGHRLVVLDLLGYGRSDRPLDRPVDVRAHAKRVVDVLNELTIDRACLVGHGFGGGVAQALAIQCPDRVSHVCLVDSAGFDHWPSVTGWVARALRPAAAFLPPASVMGLLRADLVRGYSSRERATRSVELYLRPFAGTEGRDAIVAHLRGIASVENAKLTHDLGSIAAPTSVVWGSDDRVMPLAIAHRLGDAIPRAAVEIIPGARHVTPEEAPRQVAEAIQRLLMR